MVQDIKKWGPAEIHDEGPRAYLRWIEARALRFHVWVVRDPVDRYISAWHSKVKCCGNKTSVGFLGVPCYQDVAGHYGTKLREQTNRLEGVSETQSRCMFFAEYVDAIVEMHAQNRAHELNSHWKPQHMACPPAEPAGSVPTYVNTVQEIGGFLRGLQNFGFKTSGTEISVERTHITPRGDWEPQSEAVQKLCLVSAPEYVATGLPISPFCKDNLAMIPAMKRAKIAADDARAAAVAEQAAAESNDDGASAGAFSAAHNIGHLNVGCVPVARYLNDMVIWKYCQRQLVHQTACTKAKLMCEFRAPP